MFYTCLPCPCMPCPSMPCPNLPCPCVPCTCMPSTYLAQHGLKSISTTIVTLVTSSASRDALQVLVELAQERDEDIPALVYEARSTGQPRRLHRPQQQQQNRHERQEGRGLGGDSPVASLQEVTVAQSSPCLREQLQRGSSETHLPATLLPAQTPGLYLGYNARSA